MALTSPTSSIGQAAAILDAAPMEHPVLTAAELTVSPDEPDDGIQSGRDLIIKNALVFGSAGLVLAMAAWLLV